MPDTVNTYCRTLHSVAPLMPLVHTTTQEAQQQQVVVATCKSLAASAGYFSSQQLPRCQEAMLAPMDLPRTPWQHPHWCRDRRNCLCFQPCSMLVQ